MYAKNNGNRRDPHPICRWRLETQLPRTLKTTPLFVLATPPRYPWIQWERNSKNNCHCHFNDLFLSIKACLQVCYKAILNWWCFLCRERNPRPLFPKEYPFKGLRLIENGFCFLPHKCLFNWSTRRMLKIFMTKIKQPLSKHFTIILIYIRDTDIIFYIQICIVNLGFLYIEVLCKNA